ncbi:MAG: response regulator [Anaerolinea sp.]|nr:response regulator [Anaerolinea sp.]MCC6973368.1 response regulator [Anaerolineae bacterium]
MPKVMIVDDDKITVTLLQTLLGLDGFDVVVVPRGGDVLSTAHREQPDVFMIDYNLSDMTGVQVVTQIRGDANLSHTPILMASGMNVEAEALRAGASQFIIKPFDPAKLAGIFHKLLEA